MSNIILRWLQKVPKSANFSEIFLWGRTPGPPKLWLRAFGAKQLRVDGAPLYNSIAPYICKITTYSNSYGTHCDYVQ